MSPRKVNVAAIVASFHGQDLDPHYLAFFACFNRQLFFEAHEALEELWLARRHDPMGSFYKGLIQLAGAFVHLQKNRPQPAIALFKLALANLEPYPTVTDRLHLGTVRSVIQAWLLRIAVNVDLPLDCLAAQAPRLVLEESK